MSKPRGTARMGPPKGGEIRARNSSCHLFLFSITPSLKKMAAFLGIPLFYSFELVFF